MYAIIDGGSTKADWYFKGNDGSSKSLTTTGFNPNYDSSESIQELLKKELVPAIDISLSLDIHYYGSGCWDSSRKMVVSNAMEAVLPKANINIYHDLLAAARATCGEEAGIACILGTGSNSVLYDGQNEIDNVNSLGFLLGDEGSGAVIGKELVKSFFYREMPEELQYIMHQECPNGKLDILDNVYGNENGVPAAYLASFVKKFYPHKQHPFVWQLVKKCFEEFFQRHVFKYNDFRSLPIHFVGSVAYHFQDILGELIKEHQLHMGVVLQKPIEALFNFHHRKELAS